MSRTGQTVLGVLLTLAAIGLVVLADTAWLERRALYVSYLMLLIGGCMLFYAAGTMAAIQRRWRSARFTPASRHTVYLAWFTRILADLWLVSFIVRALLLLPQ